VEEFFLKIVASLGVPGLVTFCAYRLLDKWAAKFLEIHDKQATAITDLASSVKTSSGDQKDVIMAVRVLAAKVDDVSGWAREIKDSVAALGAGDKK
jgi:hypothetical protein